MKPVLLGFICLDPNGNHHFSYTFGLSSTDKVKTSTSLHLWLIWLLFTLWDLGVFSSAGKFFCCPFPSLQLSKHVFTVYMLSPQPEEHVASPTSNCLHPLQRQTRLRQLSSDSKEAWIWACLWVQHTRPWPNCVFVYQSLCVYVCEWERQSMSGRANI